MPMTIPPFAVPSSFVKTTPVTGAACVKSFAWLTAYRMRLLALEDDARFYIGLVDVILAIRAQQTTADAVVA